MLLSHADFPKLQQALIFLDTGLTGGAFAVSEIRAQTLGIDRDRHASLVGTGGGGRVTGIGAQAHRLGLHRLARHEVNGLLLDSLSIESAFEYRINGLIGHDMLRDSRLNLDFANMRLRVSPAI